MPGFRAACTAACAQLLAQFVIPEAERSEAIGNPVLQGGGYWIPRSPLRGAGE